MANFVENVLQSAGLLDLLSSFQENDIDEHVLRSLLNCTSGSLEERLFAGIVPSVGQRLKILSAIRTKIASVSPLPNQEEVSRFNCSICSNQCSSFSAYWEHLKSFHEIKGTVARIDCPLCSTTFTKVKSLRKLIQARLCSKLKKVISTSGLTHQSSSAVSEVEFGYPAPCNESFPTMVEDVFRDHRLTFVQALQMSGSIRLSKSAEILCAANALVNSVVELAKGYAVSSLSHNEIIVKMNGLKDPFPKSSSSQYQIEKLLKNQNHFVEASEVRLGMQYKYDKAKGVMREKFANSYHFRLLETLPKIIKKYKQVLNSVLGVFNPNLIQNFKSGKLYSTFEGEPLCLQIYYDEIEICNPLGAKAKIHKLGMFYFIIANFLSHLTSQLACIFPLLVVKSKYIRKYGINSVLQPIVDELNIVSETRKSSFLIGTGFTSVKLLQICGDNLGLHSALGFTEGFNATFRCRFCKANKEQTFSDLKANLRRNLEKYLEDLALENLSLTGIKQNSVLNEITGFHVTKNYAPDIMHDILEGICIFELKLLLKYILQKKVHDVGGDKPQTFFLY